MTSSQSQLFRHNGNLYQNPELYDLVVNTPPHETDFYLKQAGRLGNNVLELACGTGRVSFALMTANPHLQYDGLDLSKPMLEYARKKAEHLKEKATFYEGNMESFDLFKKYDLIFVPLSSILYLHSNVQFQNCFNCVRDHLEENGEFIFSVFNPSRDILSRSPEDRYEVKRFINPENGKEVLVEQSSNYDSEAAVNYATHYYSDPEQKDFFSHPVHLRMLFPNDIQKMIHENDYEITALYGDYLGNKFTTNSKFQIIACKPK